MSPGLGNPGDASLVSAGNSYDHRCKASNVAVHGGVVEAMPDGEVERFRLAQAIVDAAEKIQGLE